jgi:hypothetical protein
VGLLKIATKMFSRQQQAPKALNLLHALLCGGNAVAVENYADWFGLRDHSGNVEELCSSQYLLMTRQQRKQAGVSNKNRRDIDFLRSWPKHIISAMTAQIAVELWQMLTLNVSTLSHIQLAQWQQLFDIIAIASAGDAFAAGKAYEVMAWLIHEPRLRGEVPVFSLSGVRPLLTNSRAHDSVAVGAVELLTHLHNRLEVLVKSEEIVETSGEQVASPVSPSSLKDRAYDELQEGSNSPELWESCWVPILQVMALGVLDRRVSVHTAAAAALSSALRDRHCYVVPVDVVVTVLSTVLVHTASQLNDRMLDSFSKHAVAIVEAAAPKEDASQVGEVVTRTSISSDTAEAEKDASDEVAQITGGGSDSKEEIPSVEKLELRRGERLPGEIILVSMCEVCFVCISVGILTCLIFSFFFLKVFRSHLNRLSGHSLFEYVWLSVLRVLLFYEQHHSVFAVAASSNRQGEDDCDGVLDVVHLVPGLLSDVLNTLESAGLFTEKHDAKNPHRPHPPVSRNNVWFATSCEMSKVMPADRIKVLFPKFVLPS